MLLEINSEERASSLHPNLYLRHCSWQSLKRC